LPSKAIDVRQIPAGRSQDRAFERLVRWQAAPPWHSDRAKTLRRISDRPTQRPQTNIKGPEAGLLDRVVLVITPISPQLSLINSQLRLSSG